MQIMFANSLYISKHCLHLNNEKNKKTSSLLTEENRSLRKAVEGEEG